jgi:hypothetical protein
MHLDISNLTLRLTQIPTLAKCHNLTSLSFHVSPSDDPKACQLAGDQLTSAISSSWIRLQHLSVDYYPFDYDYNGDIPHSIASTSLTRLQLKGVGIVRPRLVIPAVTHLDIEWFNKWDAQPNDYTDILKSCNGITHFTSAAGPSALVPWSLMPNIRAAYFSDERFIDDENGSTFDFLCHLLSNCKQELESLHIAVKVASSFLRQILFDAIMTRWKMLKDLNLVVHLDANNDDNGDDDNNGGGSGNVNGKHEEDVLRALIDTKMTQMTMIPPSDCSNTKRSTTASLKHVPTTFVPSLSTSSWTVHEQMEFLTLHHTDGLDHWRCPLLRSLKVPPLSPSLRSLKLVRLIDDTFTVNIPRTILSFIAFSPLIHTLELEEPFCEDTEALTESDNNERMKWPLVHLPRLERLKISNALLRWLYDRITTGPYLQQIIISDLDVLIPLHQKS